MTNGVPLTPASLLALNEGRTAGTEVFLLGRQWRLDQGVFSPTSDPSTTVFTKALLTRELKASFYEMGCGAAITAISIALARPECTVLASDSSINAVHCANANALRHGVDSRVSVRLSDLFEESSPPPKDTTVYWNSPFVAAPAPHESDLSRAIYDSNYAVHERFFEQCARLLTPSSEVILGTNSFADHKRLQFISQRYGYLLQAEWTKGVAVGPTTVNYQLLTFSRDYPATAATSVGVGKV